MKQSGFRFEMANGIERTERLVGIRHVLYLIFNEGYGSSVGPSLLWDRAAIDEGGLLERMSDNPMVTLNRAVALAMVHGVMPR